MQTRSTSTRWKRRVLCNGALVSTAVCQKMAPRINFRLDSVGFIIVTKGVMGQWQLSEMIVMHDHDVTTFSMDLWYSFNMLSWAGSYGCNIPVQLIHRTRSAVTICLLSQLAVTESYTLVRKRWNNCSVAWPCSEVVGNNRSNGLSGRGAEIQTHRYIRKQYIYGWKDILWAVFDNEPPSVLHYFTCMTTQSAWMCRNCSAIRVLPHTKRQTGRTNSATSTGDDGANNHMFHKSVRLSAVQMFRLPKHDWRCQLDLCTENKYPRTDQSTCFPWWVRCFKYSWVELEWECNITGRPADT